MLLFEANPLNLSLVKTESAPAPGAPTVVGWQSEAARLEEFNYRRFIQALFHQRENYLQVPLTREFCGPLFRLVENVIQDYLMYLQFTK